MGLVVVAVARDWASVVVVAVGRRTSTRSPQTDPVTAGYAAWRSGPARGDLAGDQAFTGAVLAAWAANPAPADRPDQAVLADRPLGPARVAWAGTVAGRPTAVVFQEAMVTQEEIPELDDGAGGPSDLWAYARADPDGTVRIVAVDLRISGRMPPAGVLGAWVDADRAVALLLDLGVPTQRVARGDRRSRRVRPVVHAARVRCGRGRRGRPRRVRTRGARCSLPSSSARTWGRSPSTAWPARSPRAARCPRATPWPWTGPPGRTPTPRPWCPSSAWPALSPSAATRTCPRSSRPPSGRCERLRWTCSCSRRAARTGSSRGSSRAASSCS